MKSQLENRLKELEDKLAAQDEEDLENEKQDVVDDPTSTSLNNPNEMRRQLTVLTSKHEETLEQYKILEFEKNKSIGQKNFVSKEKDNALKRLQSAYDELDDMDKKMEKKD